VALALEKEYERAQVALNNSQDVNPAQRAGWLLAA
jgi:hypothetical protein